MSGGDSKQREDADILKTQQQLSTFPGAPGAVTANSILNPTWSSKAAPSSAGAAAASGTKAKTSGDDGLSASERAQLLKLEKKDGIGSSIMVSSDGAQTRKFDRMLSHLQAVGSQANQAMAEMVKHRGQEKTAKAAVKKIQQSEEKSESSSDSALLTITSILGKYNGMGLLADPKIKKGLNA